MRETSETKIHDQTITTEVNSTGSLTHITGIAQGVTEVTRIGDRLWPKSLTVQLCLKNGNASAAASCNRVMIVRSRLQRALTSSDLPAVQGITDYNKIFVLYDKYITVTGPDGAGPQSVTRKIFIKKKRFLRLEYAAASTVTVMNGVYIWLVGDFAAANAAAPDIEIQTHMAYNDL